MLFAETVMEILILQKQGMGVREIARQLGLSRTAPSARGGCRLYAAPARRGSAVGLQNRDFCCDGAIFKEHVNSPP